MPVNSQHWLKSLLPGSPDLELHDLRIDSRAVKPGDVFIALPGTKTDGNLYIEQALANGAALVLTSQGSFTDQRIQLLPNLASLLPELAASFYGKPQQQLTLIGVTGTNGKSSVSCFIAQLAAQLGIKSAVIGTLGYGDWQQLTPLNNTTPHFVDLQRIFAELVSTGVRLVAMEVSSHALVQQRVAGLYFAAAVFTNLSRDHLDYHGTMQAYAEAKALLFRPEQSALAVLNLSDETGANYAKHSLLPVYGYGAAADCAEQPEVLCYQQLQPNLHGTHCQLLFAGQQTQQQFGLLGEFNVQNALAAIRCLQALGQPLSKLQQAATLLLPVAGRMEQYPLANGALVVVDYAHTPDALQQTLKALRLHCSNQLWCVFGCGGDRDKGKRPLMGQLAEQLADKVILTSDNPRTEDPLQILRDIAAGMQPQGTYSLVPERRLAIKQAVIGAVAGDIVLVAGKGHETEQIIGTKAYHYDERAYVKQLVAEMAS
ncbi:UDP-N-acetylmuramoyl-L-alanyl-D-glutamate--2,6-diaminopimelate ligase [Alishewanella longhuensis]|uniref:UDP-N-acetylmuramoyl-L-alanyl-D-glutamate--2,6-diaminopimelate ligase n=1 Tax=Alishewanella longhuensis TaxID=1091037 RepID=A0ABQ3L029_9ALTE|nr:UDP-N-acetylmuramoyl-L-alanyl-D-glutamate--2,6-diaminopimelate ligase [Alishewanella longhuensis]GHG72309.1 UDP-N-acetylmuramoyl-L-alanyl-D-glutamate--2,6-diaminopimelate ligase [Alishewanella longhuensis]